MELFLDVPERYLSGIVIDVSDEQLNVGLKILNCRGKES